MPRSYDPPRLRVLRSRLARIQIPKSTGNYYSILGLYGDNGKENGNYCSILSLHGDNA